MHQRTHSKISKMADLRPDIKIPEIATACHQEAIINQDPSMFQYSPTSSVQSPQQLCIGGVDLSIDSMPLSDSPNSSNDSNSNSIDNSNVVKNSDCDDLKVSFWKNPDRNNIQLLSMPFLNIFVTAIY